MNIALIISLDGFDKGITINIHDQSTVFTDYCFEEDSENGVAEVYTAYVRRWTWTVAHHPLARCSLYPPISKDPFPEIIYVSKTLSTLLSLILPSHPDTHHTQ